MQFRSLIVGFFVVASLGVLTTRADGGEYQEFPKDNPYGAFVDTYNFAIAQGATAEWQKLEGVAIDATRKRLFLAVTSITGGMSDNKGDIQLKNNPCGAVFMGQLDDNYNLTAVTPVVVGGPFDAHAKDYACNADAIANPDNIFGDAIGNLWIGEDADFHRNQFLWMWDGKELKRFAALPEGSEVTGLRVQSNGTVFMNVQHPSATNLTPYDRSVIGVFNGFKAGDDFKSLPIPTGDAAKQVMPAAGVYQVLGRAGEPIAGSTGGPIFGEITQAGGGVMTVCNNPDGNMFIPTNTGETEGYLYTNFECVPGGVSRLHIKQNADGTWKAIEGSMVDFSAVGGTWINCNASVTPWNTGLTSEEFPPDVKAEWDARWAPIVGVLRVHLGMQPNPYNYGYLVELIPSNEKDGSVGTEVVKHYVTGRFSKEIGLVMPGQKTIYFGDDGTDRVLYKFVAEHAGDLSVGTLYAARIKQDGETLNIEWIKLGSGTDAEIAKAVAALLPTN